MFGFHFSHVNATGVLTHRQGAARLGVGSSLPLLCAAGGMVQPDGALPLGLRRLDVVRHGAALIGRREQTRGEGANECVAEVSAGHEHLPAGSPVNVDGPARDSMPPTVRSTPIESAAKRPPPARIWAEEQVSMMPRPSRRGSHHPAEAQAHTGTHRSLLVI